MRFFKRRTELEGLQRQIQAVESQIGKLKQDIAALKSNGPIDPILKKFLEERFGFSYEVEKSKLEMVVRQKETQLTELEREKAKIQPAIQEASFQQKLRDMQIHFEGLDVEGYVGSVVKIHCSHCGHRFQTDLRNHGSFNNVTLCSNETALNQIYAMKANRVWPFSCEKCHIELDIWILRDKIE
jgi:uncharacterized protein (DUF342 family)